MRDVNRIDPLLARLGEVWKRYPDLRLGQLLHVAAGGDPYNVECDALVSRLEAWDAERRGLGTQRVDPRQGQLLGGGA
jgi:hypothetical protein